MLNSTRLHMLKAVKQHANREFELMISSCEALYFEIKSENSRCAKQLIEVLITRANKKTFETKFREFIAVYTANLYENDTFKQACEHFSEYQRVNNALKNLW